MFLILFLLVVAEPLFSSQVGFLADIFSIPHELMDEYFIREYGWEGRSPAGVYFQWVPHTALHSGYPDGNRFAYRKAVGYNFLKRTYLFGIWIFETVMENCWEVSKGMFVVTLDYTGWYTSNSMSTTVLSVLSPRVMVGYLVGGMRMMSMGMIWLAS